MPGDVFDPFFRPYESVDPHVQCLPYGRKPAPFQFPNRRERKSTIGLDAEDSGHPVMLAIDRMAELRPKLTPRHGFRARASFDN